MKMIDPHIHMTSRTTDNYQAMADAGIMVVVETAFWLGQPRTTAGAFKEGVDAVGEVGYDDQTPAEHKLFALQVEMAMEHHLPVLVHTPHRDKKKGTIRSISLIRELRVPENMVLVDHNNEETLPLVLDTGCWAGHSIYPKTKMDEQRKVALVERYGSERIIVNSAADWGVSDPLKVPKTAKAMQEAGIPEEEIRRIVWEKPAAFFSQSGNMDLSDIEVRPSINQTLLFDGNSVLRGQTPIVAS